MAFSRTFNGFDKLRDHVLFKKHLLRDITKGDVFPAVRKGRIDFYYGGGLLFSFDGSHFETHVKYASVFEPLNSSKSDQFSVRDQDLDRLRLILKFEDGYSSIKKNCSRYTRKEDRGIAEIYTRFSCTKRERESPIVVLDIEASFQRERKNDLWDDSQTKRERLRDTIDLILLDTEQKELKFIEVKNYDDPRIRGTEPPVVKQVKDYARQLEKKHDEILLAYKEHTRILNSLFPEQVIPEPQKVNPFPRLFLFGYDGSQREDKNKGLPSIVTTLEKHNMSVYHIGKPGNAAIKNIFGQGQTK